MKILVVLSRVPYKLDKGDKLRAYNQIKELAKHHEIILFALDDKNTNESELKDLRIFCSNVTIAKLSRLDVMFNLFRSVFDGRPFQVGYFYSGKAQKKLDELVVKHSPEHIYCQLIRTAEYAQKYTIPKTLDYMDVFSKGIERRIATASVFLKPLFKWEYERLLKYEHDVFDKFNNKTIISEQDKSLIPHPKRQEIKVIPNGVDTNCFRPLSSVKEFELLFNGNMSYPPNVESVEYLVNKVLPLVWNKKPQLRLLISGSSPSARVLALKSDKVVVSGWVDDIRENFAKSKILVAPMQISIGLQNKLLEAMAMQLPCITSTLANNALGAKNDEQIIVADTPQQYADAIIDLLNNPQKAKRIAMEGYNFVLDNFNWKGTVDKLLGSIENKKS